MSLALSGRSILGIAIAVIGVLTMAWGTTQAAQDFEGFKTLGLGGVIALATGMCLVSEVPTALQIGGIWVAAAASAAYIFTLPNWEFLLQMMSVVPVVALAVWITTLLAD